MKHQLNVFGNLHAVFPRRHAHGDLAEGAGRGRRDRLAAQSVEARDAFLAEQHKRTLVDAGGDVNNIGAGERRHHRRRPALINIDLARDQPLHRDSCADCADIHTEPVFGEVTRLLRDQQWHGRMGKCRDGDLETLLLRLDRLRRRRRQPKAQASPPPKRFHEAKISLTIIALNLLRQCKGGSEVAEPNLTIATLSRLPDH